MKSHKVEKIEKLEDVFYAVLGGEPDSSAEMWHYLEDNKMGKLLYDSDIDRILHHDGYFADETVDAVYAVLPLAIPLSDGRRYLMNLKTFRQLNHEKSQQPNSTLVNISFPRALEVYEKYFNFKMSTVIEMIYENKLRKGEIKDEAIPVTSLYRADLPVAEDVEEKRKRKKNQYNLKHKDKAMHKPRNKTPININKSSREI